MAELFRWLRACVAMADSEIEFRANLSVTIAARTLSAAVCSLLPMEVGSSGAIMTAQLRNLRDPAFAWPSSVRLDTLPPLPKNITKNFAAFFHEGGREFVDLETERMKEQVGLRF